MGAGSRKQRRRRRRRRRRRWWWRIGGTESPLAILVFAAAAFAGAMVAKGEDTWWKPSPRINWDWQLAGTVTTKEGVEMYDIDLFDIPKQTIQHLQEAGIIVVCYFSAGTYEAWRPDGADFPVVSLGSAAADEEWWININHEEIREVMEARLDLAVSKGCDAVEPDEVEVYLVVDSGLTITFEDQLNYNVWMAEQAHDRNLSVGLKNDDLQVENLEQYYDWALVTDCVFGNTCGNFTPFFDAGKAVFNAEFLVSDLDFCHEPDLAPLDIIVKNIDLDEQRCSCNFPESNVDCPGLLSSNNPTPAPFGDSESPLSRPDGGGSSDSGAATWVILTAIAVAVLAALAASLVYHWRRRTINKTATDGVSDFTLVYRTADGGRGKSATGAGARAREAGYTRTTTTTTTANYHDDDARRKQRQEQQ